ncbi:hypothetical protein F3K43_41540 [Streptomyces sp. LBUM 1476]|nr:hypothetical protein [Streptomyces sp. LBUM 1476]
MAPTPTNTKTPYTNWRPPLIGVSLFVPVDGDALLVAKTMGGIVLPVGGVREGQTVEHAAREVLPGGELPHLRRVFTDRRQMRRRAVVTHVLATAAMSQDETLPFAYRDPRGMLLILTIREAISRMPPRTRSRVELAALTLAGGTVRLPFPTPK